MFQFLGTHGSCPSVGLLEGNLRTGSTILEVFWAVWTSVRGFPVRTDLRPPNGCSSTILCPINDFSGILGHWDFPKGFFGYAQVLGFRRAALRGFGPLSTIIKVFRAVRSSLRGFWRFAGPRPQKGCSRAILSRDQRF